MLGLPDPEGMNTLGPRAGSQVDCIQQSLYPTVTAGQALPLSLSEPQFNQLSNGFKTQYLPLLVVVTVRWNNEYTVFTQYLEYF